MATITLTVTVANPGSGNRYYIDGVLQATVSAIPGNTYIFDQADGTNSGHPLRLSITSNGTHGGGSAYTTGVTTSGTPGSANAYTQIVVTATTVQTLYYYCTNHSGMGGSFNVGNSSTVQLQDRKGFDVQNFSADQTSVGQIYYNSASGSFKAVKSGGAPIGSWSSGGALNTVRQQLGGAGESNAAALAFGGDSGSGQLTVCEKYNGSTWTEVADLASARSNNAGFGTSTAAISAGGRNGDTALNLVESWNGSSWSEIAEINTGRYGASGVGTTTSGLVFGGQPDSGGGQAVTESWNGSAWTEVSDLNTARGKLGKLGTSNSSALAAGGGNGPPGTGQRSETEVWDGSSWTEVAEINTARGSLYTGSGTATDGIIFSGGEPTPSAKTESWNGSSWTEVADLAAARNSMASGSLSSSSAIGFGGGPSVTGATEEWTAAAFEVKTLTTS